MDDTRSLVPATELAAKSPIRFAGESAEYRAARTALLAEEVELRRHIERVARRRRALPPGPAVAKDYAFTGREGPVTLAELFGPHETLVVYKFMYGPERQQPCPMCMAAMDAWDGIAHHVGRKASLVMVGRSPYERIAALGEARGWKHLRLYSDGSGDYTRDFVHPEDADVPGLNVFTRRDGTIRHFWGDEMGHTADPGEDPRGAPDLVPLWSFLDLTPEGRDPDWYPKLSYPDDGA